MAMHLQRAARLLLLAGLNAVAAPTAPRAQQPARAANRPFTMALVGDAIITRPMSQRREPEFLRMIDLMRTADVTFANLEMLFHDYEPFPAHESGGTWMRARPALARELVWAGIDIVGMANNHTGDYGVEGMRLTRKYVAEAGLVGAGTGEDLREAREARFFDSPNGRVALVSVASTFPPHSAASRSRAGVRGRPGLNPLRFTSTRVVTAEQLEALRAALRGAGVNAPASGGTLSVGTLRFTVGDSLGVRTEPDSTDLRDIAAVVRDAAGRADFVIVSIHAHEAGATNAEPARFLPIFARAMIDAGADVFVGHGPHALRGIEIRNGRPIFYSLGDWMFENETVERLPAESFAQYGLGDSATVADFNRARYAGDTRGFPVRREVWESVVARVRWEGKALSAIELHPITLGFGLPTNERGRPKLADRALGEKIIGDLIARSKPFGTTVEWRDGIGVVRLR
jgi:poly-gamma-glutamate synthesis protein (capsule biosynthesis protein)